MSKTRTTLTIDESVMRAVRLRAASTGRGESEVIEQAVRRDLGLDFLDSMWKRAELGEDEAMDLAIEAQQAVRRRRN